MYNKYFLKDLFTLRKEKVPTGEFLIINGDILLGNSPYQVKEYNYNNFPNPELQKAGYNKLFRKGDVLFLTIGTKKKVWFADQEGVCNSDIKVLLAKRIVFSEYLIALLVSRNISRWVRATIIGSVIPRIAWNSFIQKEIFIPSLEEQKKVISHLANLRKYWAKIEQLSQKIEQLSLSLSLDN